MEDEEAGLIRPHFHPQSRNPPSSLRILPSRVARPTLASVFFVTLAAVPIIILAQQERRRFLCWNRRRSGIAVAARVSRILFATRRRLLVARGGRSFLWDRGCPRPRATYPQGLDRAGTSAPCCLVLLPVGFAVPFVSPRTRCALTAPFHPYLSDARGKPRG